MAWIADRWVKIGAGESSVAVAAVVALKGRCEEEIRKRFMRKGAGKDDVSVVELGSWAERRG